MANITAEMILLMKIMIKVKIIFLWSCINAKASLTKHSCRLQLNWLEWVFLSLYVQANVSHTNLVNVKFLVMNKFVNEMW